MINFMPQVGDQVTDFPGFKRILAEFAGVRIEHERIVIVIGAEAFIGVFIDDLDAGRTDKRVTGVTHLKGEKQDAAAIMPVRKADVIRQLDDWGRSDDRQGANVTGHDRGFAPNPARCWTPVNRAPS